ncbi:heavy metal translocating P-type ATPase [Rhizobium calliandrae]|uniref:P-type Zn(2+) transporter n=1 Tax=Rhizobium calliandrae TaxID=1312182 RepID=A0ABT7KNQ5_9HYPH|nr:heavy metal translocating P-type ATPase [Rhizobium calliandrae]MDL2410279.1 heavy metal translocating P-type ATPase [Rhizobium calliandrae]
MSEITDPLSKADVKRGSGIQSLIPRAWPTLLLVLAAAGLAAGALLQWFAIPSWSVLILVSATVAVLSALVLEVLFSLRKGEFGLDIIAALSMAAALWFGEYLASAIIAVMYAGGQFLESYAQKRAESGMTELLARAPRLALRVTDAGLSDIPIAQVVPGDKLLVRKGDVIPVDGRIEGGLAVLNEAALTGESLPVRRDAGQMIMSGASNVGDAFEMIAVCSAAESTYAGIVRLIAQARSSKAHMSRLADRYALAFLALTLTIAGLAAFLSADPARIVAVLVVATPCPLILAVPVALVAGMSKSARTGVLIKGASVLEAMATITVVVFDKTGTLTTGEPTVTRIETDLDPDEVLALAASVDQASAHTMGRTVVEEAKRRGLSLSKPAAVTEVAGEGIEGFVGNRKVAVGGWSFIAPKVRLMAQPLEAAKRSAMIYVAVDGECAGMIFLEDPVRNDAPAAIDNLRRSGVKRFTLATGDRMEVASAIGDVLHLDAVKAQLTPVEKVETVKTEAKHGRVMMIGDGVNDAPALAAADVGIAVGQRNLAAAAEAADVVLLRNDLRHIATSLEIARQSRRIALQSVYSGIGLSVIAMIVASFGYLTPVQGALLQEVIDIAVIFNALRAL